MDTPEGRSASFATIWTRHNLSTPTIAIIAGVSYDTVKAMRANEPVPESDARYVLRAMSQQTGEDYTLATVDVAILPKKRRTHV